MHGTKYFVGTVTLIFDDADGSCERSTLPPREVG
jgi:hypothetical protein